LRKPPPSFRRPRLAERRWTAIAELRGQDGLLGEFDERLWHTLVDYATVYSENDVRFTFKDGTEMKM
ncbi:MAG: hypothetical protein LBS16_03375, partial [Prevotellaceae bacterium]|jgi:hypothetical protein|nr:hypothetical protein [Prevotellaceae bacterium]